MNKIAKKRMYSGILHAHAQSPQKTPQGTASAPIRHDSTGISRLCYMARAGANQIASGMLAWRNNNSRNKKITANGYLVGDFV
jgi:hypothetical protein